MFEAERRLIDYTYAADEDVHTLCSTCHSMGRVISERRTRDEWVGLLDDAPLLLSAASTAAPAASAAAAAAARGRCGGGGGGATAAQRPRPWRTGRTRRGEATRGSRSRGAGSPRAGVSADVSRNGPHGRPRCGRRGWRAAGRLPATRSAKARSTARSSIADRPDTADGFLTEGTFRVRPHRPDAVTRRSRADCLHRVPMARTIGRHARRSRHVARGGVHRTKRTGDQGPMVHRARTTRPAST